VSHTATLKFVGCLLHIKSLAILWLQSQFLQKQCNIYSALTMNIHRVMYGKLPNDTLSAAVVLLSLHSEYVTVSDELDGIA
jgi:hypothetical protein